MKGYTSWYVRKRGKAIKRCTFPERKEYCYHVRIQCIKAITTQDLPLCCCQVISHIVIGCSTRSEYTMYVQYVVHFYTILCSIVVLFTSFVTCILSLVLYSRHTIDECVAAVLYRYCSIDLCIGRNSTSIHFNIEYTVYLNMYSNETDFPLCQMK